MGSERQSVARQAPWTIACFAGGSLYGWSGLSPSVSNAFQASNASTSMIFSIAIAFFSAGVLAGPRIIARVAPQFSLAILAFSAAMFLVVAAIVPAYLAFMASFGIGFGFIAGTIYAVSLSVASQSPNRRWLIPLNVASFGLGGAIFGVIFKQLEETGWELIAIVPLAIFFVVLAGIGSIVPSNTLFEPHSNIQKEPIEQPVDRGVVHIWIVFFSGSIAGLVVLSFAAQIIELNGSTTQFAAFTIFLVACGNMFGRLSVGSIAGVAGPEGAAAIALMASIIGVSGLLFVDFTPLVIGFLVIVALGYGQVAASIPLILSQRVQGQSFANTFGWVFTGWGVAGLSGPWAAGWLLDWTQSFQFVFVMCLAFLAVSLGTLTMLKKKERKA